MKDSQSHQAPASLMTLSEVAGYLKVAEKTVSRMLHRGEIPAVKIANQWRFSRDTLNDWLMSGMRSAPVETLDALRADSPVPRSLSRLLPDGGVLAGLSPEPLAVLFQRLSAPLVAAGIIADAESQVRQLLAREALLTTAVGEGIALPHTREPSALPGRFGLVVGLVPDGIDFGAPDGRPVTILVLLCADTVAHHLEMMVQVALALRDEAVVSALREARGPADGLAALIAHDQRRLFGRLASQAADRGRTAGPDAKPTHNVFTDQERESEG